MFPLPKRFLLWLLPAVLLFSAGCSSRSNSEGGSGYSRRSSAETRAERSRAAEETARRWTRKGLDAASAAASKAVEMARWVGPKVLAGARWAYQGAQEVYETYGPAVRAAVGEVYARVGPALGRAAKAVALDYGPRALAATKDFLLAAGQTVHDQVAPIASGVFLGISKGVADATGVTEATQAARDRWRQGLESLSKMRARWMGREGSLEELSPELLAESAGESARSAARGETTGAMLSFQDPESFAKIEFEGLGGNLHELTKPASGLSVPTRAELRAALEARQKWRLDAFRGSLRDPTWISLLSEALQKARRERSQREGRSL